MKQERTQERKQEPMPDRLRKLILEALEHEMGGVKVYTAALRCAELPELEKEWRRYLEQTQSHVSALQRVCEALSLDPEQETPGRQIVRGLGEALVRAMEQARDAGDRQAAQIVAAECVVLAETKDHLNWELLGKCAEQAAEHATDGDSPDASPTLADTLARAYDEIEDQEDEHLYHTKGWCRELWIQSLGMNAVLPPPEERRQVKTAIGAALAKQSAEKARAANAVVAPGKKATARDAGIGRSVPPREGRRRAANGQGASRHRHV
jgi:hypothetical protein